MKQDKYNSQNAIDEALGIARATQKPGQTKEQTKAIAQGIQKGIAEYKKRHSQKQREEDKKKKKRLKQAQSEKSKEEQVSSESDNFINASILPWSLLVLSWLLFISYFVAEKV